MSKILNALNHSEQQFNQQQSDGTTAGAYPRMEDKRGINIYLLFTILIFVPAAVVMVIAIIINPMPAQQFVEKLLQQTIGPVEPVSSVRPVVQQAPTVNVEVSTGVLILDYPHFETQPLPKVQRAVKPLPLPTKQKVVEVSGEREVRQEESEVDLHRLDMSELSPEIAARLKSIMQEQPKSDAQRADSVDQSEEESIALPRNSAGFIGKLPTMNFQTHIYASQADRRWIKVNGMEAVEGDDIATGVTLIEIKPREVIVGFDGQTLSIPALYEWGG